VGVGKGRGGWVFFGWGGGGGGGYCNSVPDRLLGSGHPQVHSVVH